MKNNNGTLFFIGIIIGGTILFSAVNYQKFAALSSPGQIYTATPSSNLPRLLAPISTSIPVRSTRTAVPTIHIEPSATPIKILPSATTTPLYLTNEQQTDAIGYSVNGLPILVYTFGSGEHVRMIVADIHGGDEWNTTTLANQLIQYLNQNPRVIPKNVTLYILPSLNPDGEVRAHNKYGRVNSNGVDLNRNFPVNWQASWNRDGCWNYLPTSGGSSAGSEPETRALMSFIESHNIEALISYHSAALGIFPGGDPPDKNSTYFAEAIAGVSSYPYPPTDTGCIYSGTLADYAASKGIAAVDMELTNHIDTDLEINLDILEVILTWGL